MRRKPARSNNYILKGPPEALSKAFRELDCVRCYSEKVRGNPTDFFYAVGAVNGTLDAIHSMRITMEMVRVTADYPSHIRRINKLGGRLKSEDPPYKVA